MASDDRDDVATHYSTLLRLSTTGDGKKGAQRAGAPGADPATGERNGGSIMGTTNGVDAVMQRYAVLARRRVLALGYLLSLDMTESKVFTATNIALVFVEVRWQRTPQAQAYKNPKRELECC